MIFLTEEQLKKLNTVRLKNVRKRASIELSRAWHSRACECCNMINTDSERQEYEKESKTLREYLTLIHTIGGTHTCKKK